MVYYYSKKLSAGFEEAVGKAKEALKGEGFGVLTEIDVQKTLKEKLGIDYAKYVILGACNPPFAFQSLEADQRVGLLLPCNVIIIEKKGQAEVAAILPTVAMSMIDNPALKETASKVEEKLIKAVDNIV